MQLEYRVSAAKNFFNISHIVKKAIILFLILLPFQALPRTFWGESEHIFLKVISYSDEVATLCLFTLLFSFMLVKPDTYRLRIMEIPTSIPLFLFVIIASISILWNGVPLSQGAFGIYDVLKNIIVLYLFANFRWQKEDLLLFISKLKVIIIILAVAGIIGELLAIMGIEPGILTMIKEETKRLGLYRVTSLTGKGSANYLGMYMLLGFFLMYLTTEDKVGKNVGILLSLCVILFTFSRQTWMGLFIMAAFFERRLILPGLLILVVAGIMMFLGRESFDPTFYYRSFTYEEALKIFVDHPLIGAGAGMFGGVASVMFDSPYYQNWPSFYRGIVYKMGSLDAFWPSVIAELGILGFLTFLCVWIFLYRKIAFIAQWYRTRDIDLYKIGMIFKNYILALIVMCFFTGLNKPFVIYTFMALCGTYLSVWYQEKDVQMTGSSALPQRDNV